MSIFSDKLDQLIGLLSDRQFSIGLCIPYVSQEEPSTALCLLYLLKVVWVVKQSWKKEIVSPTGAKVLYCQLTNSIKYQNSLSSGVISSNQPTMYTGSSDPLC